MEEQKEGRSVKRPHKNENGSPVTIFISMHVYYCFSVMPLTVYSAGQISMGEREDSVRKCRGMFPSSHELQKSRRGGYFH